MLESIPAWRRHQIINLNFHLWSGIHPDSEFKAINFSPCRRRSKSPLTTRAPSTDRYTVWNTFFLLLTIFFFFSPLSSITTCTEARGPVDDTAIQMGRRWVTSAPREHLLQWLKNSLVGLLMTPNRKWEFWWATVWLLALMQFLLSRNISDSQTESATLGWFSDIICRKPLWYGTCSTLSAQDYKKKEKKKKDHSSVREHSPRHQPDDYRDHVLSLVFL